MSSVQNIIFDLGGVLLNLDVQRTRNAFIELGLTQIDEQFRIGHAESFFKQHETGSITDEEFIESARKLSKPGTTVQQVIKAWNVMLLDFPAERVKLLKELKKKYRVFLFSNTNAIHMEHFKNNFQKVYGYPMDDNFEIAWYSHLINKRKPDVAAFEYVIAKSGIQAADTLFIDDALVNVEGARQAGLQTVHITEGKTILDLGLLEKL